MRETETDNNSPEGFDDASSGVSGSGINGTGGLIFRYSSDMQCFINPLKTRRWIKPRTSAIFHRQL